MQKCSQKSLEHILNLRIDISEYSNRENLLKWMMEWKVICYFHKWWLSSFQLLAPWEEKLEEPPVMACKCTGQSCWKSATRYCWSRLKLIQNGAEEAQCKLMKYCAYCKAIARITNGIDAEPLTRLLTSITIHEKVDSGATLQFSKATSNAVGWFKAGAVDRDVRSSRYYAGNRA